MFKKIRVLFLSLIFLLLTTSAIWAASGSDGTAIPSGITDGKGGNPKATYISESKTLQLDSNWVLTNPIIIQNTNTDINFNALSDSGLDLTVIGTSIGVGGASIQYLDLNGKTISNGTWDGTSAPALIYVGYKNSTTPTQSDATSTITIKNSQSTGGIDFTIGDTTTGMVNGAIYSGLTDLTIDNVDINIEKTAGIGYLYGIVEAFNVTGANTVNVTMDSSSITAKTWTLNSGSGLTGVDIERGKYTQANFSIKNNSSIQMISPIKTEAGLYAGIYGINCHGSDTGNMNVQIGPNVNISAPENIAIYSSNKSETIINGSNVKITGRTGVNIRQGSFVIASQDSNNKPLENIVIEGTGGPLSGQYGGSGANANSLSNGSAIILAGGVANANISLEINGNSTCPVITSDYAYAIQQTNFNTSDSGLTTGSNPPIQVNGGVYSAGTANGKNPNKSPFSSEAATTSSPGTTFNAKNVITSGPVGPALLNTGNAAQFAGINSQGQPVFGYFADPDDAQDAAKIVNPTNPPYVAELNPSSPNQGPSYTSPELRLISVANNGSSMTYYNTGSGVEQSQNTGIEILGTGQTQIAANALQWSAKAISVTNRGTAPTFTNKYWEQTPENGKLYLTLLSDDENWEISQQISDGKTPYGDICLIYLGNDTTEPEYQSGVYEITGTAPKTNPGPSSNVNFVQPYSTNVTLSATARYIINPTNVSKVEITYNGTPASSPLQLDLSENRTFQFGYLATGGENGTTPVTGNIISWSLKNTDGSAATVATVNEKTGVVTFLQTPPANTILLLSVTVDGVPTTTPVLLQPTGSLSYDETTGIAPVYNPVTIQTSNNNFVLNNNIVTTPVQMPVNAGTLTFTSSNTNYLPYTSGTSTTGPNTYQLIPMGSSTTGTTTITATWENDGKTYTTEFDVNFVSSPVKATGIEVAEELSFVLTDPQVQNVDAKLLPTNNTVQANLLDGKGNGFTYESSDESVAVVDDFGNVTPVGSGTCTITTTAASGADLPTGKNTATTTVTVDAEPETATAISIEPTTIYLVPDGTEGTTSADLTATLTPENVDPSTVTWTASSDGISLSETSGLTTTVSSTNESGTYTVTASVPGENDEEITASATVIVADTPLVIDPAKSTITADSPDYYTVTVAPIANEALEGDSSATPQRVSIFTWSQLGQTDLDCKVAEKNANGTYSYTFPVNDTPDNNYYLDASNIIVQAYASTDPNTDGQMVMNTTWNYTDCGWDSNVIATAYVQNEGFVKPSVGANTTAGTTGQGLQMEGIRLSTPIEGVDLVYDVHVQNIGWMDQVTEGYYAGTMHQNLQVEAIHVRLTGSNASEYTVQYQAHVQDIGWQNWVADGAEAGTTGQGLQMEALKIQVVPKGTALPTN